MSNRNFIHTIIAISTLIGVFFTATAKATPEIVGKWEVFSPLPYFPIHVNLLPTGKLMMWPGDGVGFSGDDPRIWDPQNPGVLVDPTNTSFPSIKNNQITNPAPTVVLTKAGYDLFCVGHTFLADGRLLVTGGHISNFVGLPNASIYDYVTDTWTTLPDMNAGRWYPTNTVLANGDVLTISGDIDTTVGTNPLPQVFKVSTGTWRDLTSAQMQIDDYPRMFLAPNGKVFYATASATTRYLDTSGTGAWSFVASRSGGYRDYGSAVMYAPGKILVMGGGQAPPKNSAEVIDLNVASPSWRAAASMQYSRRHLNATLLPDGTVLVTGGTSASGFNDESGHVDAAELWNPLTEQWTTLASSFGIPRVYHSTAILLPDGRVFTTGGNNYPYVEIFSPPYLFKGARPTITSAPSSISYGNTFSINTPDAATISKVTLLKLGSVTHAFNQGQVINDLSFSKTAGGLNITAPSNSNVTPPGYYMLFILNDNGVPSVAKFVNVGPGTSPTVSVTAPQNGATVGGSSIVLTANASDNIGVVGVQFKLDGVNIGAEVTTKPYSLTWNSTTVNNGPHIITAVARDADGNKTTSQGVNITIDNTTLLPDVVVTELSYANGIFTSTVVNQGNAATPAGVAVAVGYSVDGKYKTWGGINGPLAAGASVTIGTNGAPYVIPDGTHTITAKVDDINRFPESNENNNQLSIQVVGGVIDTEAPTVSITAPTAGATVSGSAVTLSANASDNGSIASVQFRISGSYDPPDITTAPYTLVWDSTAVTDGPHVITATATDAAGNSTNTTINVTINNNAGTNPTVAVMSPTEGATVTGSSVTLSAVASDDTGVAGVQFKLDGADLGSEVTAEPYTFTWDSTTVTNGAHTISAVARDIDGNTTTSAVVNITVDNTVATLLPDVVVTQLSYASGIFTSTVVNQGNAATPAGVAVTVAYSVDGKYKTWGGIQGPLAAGASVTIGTKQGKEYIIPDGIHTITAKVDDVNRFPESNENNNQLSQPITVGGAGGTNPTVSITAPTAGSTITGSTVTISADAFDDTGISGVQFKLDGVNLGAEVTTAPYTITWDSTTVTNGAHTISAVARDADGNTTTSAVVNVTVDNSVTELLPDVVVTEISYANGIFTSTVVNQGNAATPAGVAVTVAYSVDGKYKTWGGIQGPLAAGASVTIGTKQGKEYIIPDGIHTITAKVDDVNRFPESNENNNQLSQPITVGGAGGTNPTVSITAPAEGATVTGSSVTLSAVASDDTGVAGVQFKLDGADLGSEVTAEPYTLTWDSTTVTNGAHTISAVVQDIDGNTTTSTVVNITVDNTGATLLPDVVVTQLSYANGIFTSTVVNQGNAATPAGVAVAVGYSVNGKYKTWGGINGPLAAGASVTIGTNGAPYVIPSGTHTIRAYVDDVNRFPESNENNNQLTQSITIP